MNKVRDRDPRGNMSFVKRHWLCATVLGALLCVLLGAFLVSSQPVEPKTVYLLPKPNLERAEILKRVFQPKRHPYVTRASNQAPVQNTGEETSESFSSESSSQDVEFDDADLEALLLGFEDETAEEKRDFPPVPDGYPFTPVWLTIPRYQKGDKPEHELIGRVLIKLRNQGERGFIDGAFRDNDGKVYPIYPDVMYIGWEEKVINDGDGSPKRVRYIANVLGTNAIEFDPMDFITDEWEYKYPEIRFVPFDDAGYDPYTFLTEDD